MEVVLQICAGFKLPFHAHFTKTVYGEDLAITEGFRFYMF
jgi:hypothetical protein